ncbi:MAG: FtsX-like permease family protein [Actinobacteria bacterium]|nr:FtsX-like permease family protein [Actinomycetota bacterium]
MLKATLKSLMTHKLRLAMTALSIVLGVSFVAGTYVLSDTLNATFTNLFTDVYAGVDVNIRGAQEFESFEFDERPTLPESLLEEVRAVDGVLDAEGSVEGSAAFVDKDGEAIIPQGPPTIGFSWSGTGEEPTNPVKLREGGPPTSPTDVVMDANTAEEFDFEVGDQVGVIVEGPVREFTVSGIVGFGDADNLAGATLAVFELETAQELFDKVGVLDTIDVIAEDGVTQGELQDRIVAAIGTEYDVSTGTQITNETTDQIQEGLGFFSIALLVFAAIALFVGSFIIANTFSIIVAQRTRELALLRAIGASRRQVMSSILIEATITGLVASAIGVGVGILVAIGLQNLLAAFDVDLPTGSLVIGPKAIVIPMVVGTLVTVIASISPARRATKVPPVAAMREGFTVPVTAGRRRLIAGTIALILGIAVLLLGLFGGGDDAASLVGLGAFLIFIGVAAMAPVIAGPLARGIGSPFARYLKIPGRLARDNSVRNPKRTSSTAAALMIGVALVGFITIFASSIKASQTELIEGTTNFDLIVQGQGFEGFPAAVEDAANEIPEIGAAAGFRSGPSRIEGQTVGIQGVDVGAAAEVLNFDMVAGSLAAAEDDGLLVSEPEAEAQGWTVGDTIEMHFQASPPREEEIKGIYERNPLAGNYIMALPDFQDAYTEQNIQLLLIQTSDGLSPSVARAAVEAGLEGFPSVEIEDQEEFLESSAAAVDQLLGLVTALLGLALIIAFIGIVNTLALSIFERTREIGLLRAIGMSRGQVRRMIRWEAVIVAILGAVLGLVIGAFFGWAMIMALADEGISVLEIPYLTLISYVIIAGIAGVGAAVFPARRASKVDVLRAVTVE